jgi:hypothetical protein
MGKRTASKAAVKPVAVIPAALKAAAAATVAAPSYQQIATRAYEIYRERSRLGKPGNADGDWLVAEAQLRKPLAP